MKKWKSLLAVAAIATMVFAMAACGDKDTAADPTEAPNPTEAPADPTEAPADPTEAPADPTEAPAPTEEVVEPTEEPAPTEEPVVDTPTEEPTPTEEVAEPTEEPAPTEEPVVEPTVAPTEAPVATEAPEATATPAPTATPEPTEAPAPTEAPEPTPEPTPTPAPTATPEPTQAPVEEKNPWAFDFSDGVGPFVQRGPVTLEIVDGALYTTGRTANWNGPAVDLATLGVEAAGKTVYVTYKAKSGEAGEIEIKCTCDQDSSAWNQLAQGPVGTDWVEFSGSFEVPAGVGVAVIYFEAAGETEKFYIDDVVFDFK